MAVIQNYESVSLISIFFSRAAARVQELVSRYRAWKMEKETRSELMRLTDAELSDIGLSRFQISTLDLTRHG